MNTLEFLSVWEVAHRWHGFDPKKSNLESVPLPVQDTIRSIAVELMRDDVLLPYTDRGLTRHHGMTAEELRPDLLAAINENRFSRHLLFDVHLAKHEMAA